MCGLLYIDFNLAGWVDISDFDIIVYILIVDLYLNEGNVYY